MSVETKRREILSPSARGTARNGWLAGRTEPLSFGYAIECRPQAEEMEGLIALIAENQLIIFPYWKNESVVLHYSKQEKPRKKKSGLTYCKQP